MAPFQKILFPTDFSDASKAMAAEVRAMAERCRAEVTVLHSFDVVPSFYLAGREEASLPVPYTVWAREMRTDALQRLEQFARDWMAGIQHRVTLEDGDPAVAIPTVAERSGADLIMMATNGAGRFRRLLMGSVAAKVLHDTGCAVFTSAHEPPPETPRLAGFRKILCGVEWNQEAERILEFARSFAQFWGAGVWVVHMAHRGEKPPGGEIEDLVQRLRLQARVRVVHANVAEGIRNAALVVSADLVIIGRGKDRGRISRLWSEVYEIIRESPCPVLSI